MTNETDKLPSSTTKPRMMHFRQSASKIITPDNDGAFEAVSSGIENTFLGLYGAQKPPEAVTSL